MLPTRRAPPPAAVVAKPHAVSQAPLARVKAEPSDSPKVATSARSHGTASLAGAAASSYTTAAVSSPARAAHPSSAKPTATSTEAKAPMTAKERFRAEQLKLQNQPHGSSGSKPMDLTGTSPSKLPNTTRVMLPPPTNSNEDQQHAVAPSAARNHGSQSVVGGSKGHTNGQAKEGSHSKELSKKHSKEHSKHAHPKAPAATTAAASSPVKKVRAEKQAPKPVASAASASASASASQSSSSSAPKRFTTHVDVHGAPVIDSDEGESELIWAPMSTRDSEKARRDAALEEIAEQHAQENDLDDEMCRVCGESWAEDALDENGEQVNDEMVACETCRQYYHQSCYGIPVVPEDDYYCWPCKDNRKQGEVTCVICDSNVWRGFCEVKYNPTSTPLSVLKASRKKKHFAHTLCALWMPHTTFADPETRNPATGVEDINKEYFNLKCSICPRRGGAKLQCRNKTCHMAFHPLCMLDRPLEYLHDDHLYDEDVLDFATGEMVRPEKEYYCKHCSPKKRLEKQRAEILAAGKSTKEIDLLIAAETPLVVPTTALTPAHKLVTVVAPKVGGRSRKHVIEVDPSDQEARAAEGKRAREQVLVELEEDSDLMSECSDQLSEVQFLAAVKRKVASSLNHTELETIDSDDEDEAPKPKRRKLRKLADTMTITRGDNRSAANSSAAASSALSAAAAPLTLEVSSASNAAIAARSAVRQQFALVPDISRSQANELEAALHRSQGRVSGADYKLRSQDLHYNLLHNSELRGRLTRGDLTCDELVRMDNTDMATSKQKLDRAAASRKNLRDVTAAPQVVVLTKHGQRVALDPSTGHVVEKRDVDPAVRRALS